ncbi:uncharacterized protein LOC135841882 [Planococcus citri]|uniref:uncharacterized protein LOC135841882 n=1 Tax=Planococcus citri TaxID=170843 RepID=UPI0031F7C5AF
MESKCASFLVLIICMSVWELSDCVELSAVPAVLLKPFMLFNRTVVGTFFDRPDYVCRMTQQGKDKLCQAVFNQKDFVQKYNVRYGDTLDKNGFDYICQSKTFNCFLNTIFKLGMAQNMLLCPLVNIANGNQVDKRYYLSTSYTSDKVIIFEAGDDGRVFAVVGVYVMDLEKLHQENKEPVSTN